MRRIEWYQVPMFDYFRKKPKPPRDQPRPRRIKDDGKRLSEYPELRDAWLKLQTDYLDEAREAASGHLQSPDSDLASEGRGIPSPLSVGDLARLDDWRDAVHSERLRGLVLIAGLFRSGKATPLTGFPRARLPPLRPACNHV